MDITETLKRISSANLRYAQSNGITSSTTTSSHHEKSTRKGAKFVVGGGGFEPPNSETSDLQSDAFGHSAIRPILIFYPA